MNYGKQFKKVFIHLGMKRNSLNSSRLTYAVRGWSITGDINMVADEIGHASVVMAAKYAK